MESWRVREERPDQDVSAINDESGVEHACRIVIDLKRDADPEVVKNSFTNLRRAR